MSAGPDPRPGSVDAAESHPAELHRAPSSCPVCGHGLALTRLGCTACGTEIGGVFRACEFCALDSAELATLRVFLASRGNLREVERHLGVSYPTARLRFTQILAKLGLADEPDDSAPNAAPDAVRAIPDAVAAEAAPSREQILAEVASGSLTPDEAQTLLGRL